MGHHTTNRFEPSDLMSTLPRDPRVVGGTYRSHYWQDTYTVLATERDSMGTIWFRVRWSSGHQTTHCTQWTRRDSVVEP